MNYYFKSIRDRKASKYISIIVASRLDNYGGNQDIRIELFLRNLSHFSEIYFKDIKWELVVIDWNPPNSSLFIKDLIIFKKYPQLPVRHISFFPETGKDQKKEHPFELHKALNLGITESKGKYCIISNFDCLFSEQIFKSIGQKILKPNRFYLADRMDISLNSELEWTSFKEKVESGDYQSIEKMNAVLNISHSMDKYGNSQAIIQSLPNEEYSQDYILNKYEKIKDYVVYWKRSARYRLKIFMMISNLQSYYKKDFEYTKVIALALARFRIHTNASGDFILASRGSLEKLKGFSILTQQYWHLDSDLVLRLLRSGLTHCTFVKPSKVFHLTSVYSGGNDSRYINLYSYESMCERWVKMW